MAQKVQFYGIKFPFTDESSEKYMFDLADNRVEQARSEVMHLLLTSKGERIRMPDFGTDLIRFIYDPSDSIQWNAVEREIREAAKRWLTGIDIVKVEVLSGTKMNELNNIDEYTDTDVFVKVVFSVDLGYKKVTEELTRKIS